MDSFYYVPKLGSIENQVGQIKSVIQNSMIHLNQKSSYQVKNKIAACETQKCDFHSVVKLFFCIKTGFDPKHSLKNLYQTGNGS